MFKWLFLLLPIAALSGWLFARKYYKNKYRPQENNISHEYFKGLNYLLNEQPDKAIDVFIQLLDVNSETVETHLALANLFRRRGETGRAIRIHQNLIARSTLNSHQKIQALVELGLDYMNAGVLDRAEQLFLDLLQQSSPPEEAIKQLLQIYQQEKHWEKAINMAERLYSNKNHQMGSLIAQFYCELAEEQLVDSHDNVIALLKKAQKHDASCVRASLIEADVKIAAGCYTAAIKLLFRIEKQAPFYISEALPRLLNCYKQTGNMDSFKIWLQQLLEQYPRVTSISLMLSHVINQQQGQKAAQDYLCQQLHCYPSIEGLHRLLKLGPTSHEMLVPLIETITDTLIQKSDRYKCHNCGFSGKTIHWQCPGCGQWGKVYPTEINLSDLENLLSPS